MTGYEPWPEQGCTLDETRERVTERVLWRNWKNCTDPGRAQKLEQHINSEFFKLMRTLKLVAYGKRNPLNQTSTFVTDDLWRDLRVTDWSRSTAAAGERSSFHEVRIYPVLLAPERAGLVAGYSLSEAFRTFVLEDPEVTAFATEGMKTAPQFEVVFKRGHCFVHGVAEWPVDSHRWAIIGYQHPDPEKRSFFDGGRDADPIEIVIAAEALIQRYRALIDMLRRHELEAQGMRAKSGVQERLRASIWRHEDFYMSAQGDVFQANEECEDPPRDWLKRCWLAVDLELGPRGRQVSTFSMKPIGHDRPRADMMANPVASPLRETIPKKNQARRPVTEPLVAALKKRRLDKSPGHRTYKQVVAEISDLMPVPPKTEQEVQALTKAVARYYHARP